MMEDQLDEALNKYLERFGDFFPTFQLLLSQTPEEALAMVEQCLSSGKDAYELGLVKEGVTY